MSVEVAGGPTVGLKSTVKLPLYVQDPSNNGDETDQKRSNKGGFFLEEIKEEEEEERRSDTSSIGVCSSADERDDQGEEVQSKEALEENQSSLSSLDSLEDSLPIKRGLSNFYSGKSKSFTSLSNTANATAKDLIKPENPFNKRRRVQLRAAWSRRASCSSLISSIAGSATPPAALSECEEEEEEEEEEMRSNRREKGKRPSLFTCTPLQNWSDDKKMPLRSPRSFSLSDLNKHAQD